MLRSSSTAEALLIGGNSASPLGRCCRSSLLWLTAVLLLAQLYLLLWLGRQQHSADSLQQQPNRDSRTATATASSIVASEPQPPPLPGLNTRTQNEHDQPAKLALPTTVPLAASVSLVRSLRSTRINHVLLYNGRWLEAIAAAKAGGPAGELFLYATAEKALLRLQTQRPDLSLVLHKANNRAELDDTLATLLASAQSSADTSSPHRLIGVYTQTYDLISDGKPFEHAAISPCTYRWLDFWGTPAEQNHIHHHLHQFLTPYDNGYNGLLGLIVQPPAANSHAATDVYAPRICLWGKEAKYFRKDRLDALQYVLEHLPAHLTAPTAHATIGGGAQWPHWLHNAGVQRGSDEYHAFLDRCTLLVGTGDPILGPTVFQAAAHGVHYINYEYSSVQTYWMNGRMRVHSQHDEAVALLPKDRVTTVNWEGHDGAAQLTKAVAGALEREEKRWKQWKADGARGAWRQGFIHPTHELNNVTERLARNLFDATICPWHADEWKNM